MLLKQKDEFCLSLTDFLVTVIRALPGQRGLSQHQLLDFIVVDTLCSLPRYRGQVWGSAGRIPSRKLSLPFQVSKGGCWHMPHALEEAIFALIGIKMEAGTLSCSWSSCRPVVLIFFVSGICFIEESFSTDQVKGLVFGMIKAHRNLLYNLCCVVLRCFSCVQLYTQPYGLYPTKFLFHRDSPDKNTARILE